MRIRHAHHPRSLLAALALLALAPAAQAADLRSPALDVTITSGPDRVTTATTATFTFEANERASFSCSLDGARPTTCASPATYTVGVGPHLFAVTAANARGAATYSDVDRTAWTVEAPPPPTTPPPTTPPPGTTPPPFALPPDPEVERAVPDVCGQTQAGPLRLRGCSTTQLALTSPDLLEHVLEEVAGVDTELDGAPELAAVDQSLQAARASLAGLVGRFGRGDPCSDASALRARLAAFDDLSGQAGELVSAFEAEAIAADRIAGLGGPDTGPGETRAFELRLHVSRMASLLGSMQDTQSTLDEVCAAVSSGLRLQGVVSRLDVARGLIWIGKLKPMTLPSGVRLPAIGIGDRVRIVGVRFDDGTGAAKTITTVGPGVDVEDLPATMIPCARLRIAPVQNFTGSAAPILHDPLGYRQDGALWLEDSARLAVVKGTCKTLDPRGFVWQHAAELRLTYKTTASKAAKTVQLAAALTSKDYPVELPGNVDPSVTASLRIGQLRRSCELAVKPGGGGSTCSDWQEVGAVNQAVVILPARGYATAQYDSTVFTLDDDDTTSFQPATVTGVVLHGKVPASATFHADGYRIVNGVSSFPTAKDVTVGSGSPFAIYNHDFFDPTVLLFNEETTGVDRPSGLRWPRVEGKRNGHPYRYGVAVPSIVRDAVTPSCGSFYRLPFAPPGSPTWVMGQGNNGTFTHKGNGAFAFDFIAPEWTPILAARGGVVAQVEESSDGNSYDDPSFAGGANKIAIVHQDGTVGRYFHMPKDGVAVVQGQKVYRGQLLGWVGNTGYSTTAHVHYEVGAGSGLPTVQIRFETADGPCVIPAPGDLLHSNNS